MSKDQWWEQDSKCQDQDQDQDSEAQDQDQDQDSENAVSRLSRDETVSRGFPLLASLMQINRQIF